MSSAYIFSLSLCKPILITGFASIFTAAKIARETSIFGTHGKSRKAAVLSVMAEFARDVYDAVGCRRKINRTRANMGEVIIGAVY